MKKNTLLTLVLLAWFAAGFASEQFTARFINLGNCSICKNRIETAAKTVPGVTTATWSQSKDETTVTYYTDSTDVYAIMHVIAGVGHDTEWFPAPDSAYNLLVGTCCEYERTYGYENVQVGYLSLMDLWLFPMGRQEMTGKISFTAYPNPAGDRITVSSNEETGNSFIATLTALSGAVAITTGFTGQASLDLSSLAPGAYILTVTSQGIMVSRQKVIRR
jgi:copper chaperone CopZ